MKKIRVFEKIDTLQISNEVINQLIKQGKITIADKIKLPERFDLNDTAVDSVVTYTRYSAVYNKMGNIIGLIEDVE